MFITLFDINPKLCLSAHAVVPDFCKITEMRERLGILNLHDF